MARPSRLLLSNGGYDVTTDEIAYWRHKATDDQLLAWRDLARWAVDEGAWPNTEWPAETLREARADLALVLSLIGERMIGGGR